MSTSTLTVPTHRRRLVLSVLAVAYAAFVALASFGLPSLLTAWFTTGDELPLRTAYVVYGVLAGLLVPALALALLPRRTELAACRGLAALAGACAVVLVLGFHPDHLVYLLAVAVPAVVLVALHPRARAALRPPQGVDRAAAAVVAVMTVPAAWYGVDLALTGRTTQVLDTASGQYTMHGQYAQGAVLAFTLLLLAAVGTWREPGRRFVVALVAVSAVTLGVAGVLFPGDPMSVGAVWGSVLLVASVAYATAGLRPPAQPPVGADEVPWRST